MVLNGLHAHSDKLESPLSSGYKRTTHRPGSIFEQAGFCDVWDFVVHNSLARHEADIASPGLMIIHQVKLLSSNIRLSTPNNKCSHAEQHMITG